MRRAAIGKIVAIDRSHDDVVEAELFDEQYPEGRQIVENFLKL